MHESIPILEGQQWSGEALVTVSHISLQGRTSKAVKSFQEPQPLWPWPWDLGPAAELHVSVVQPGTDVKADLRLDLTVTACQVFSSPVPLAAPSEVSPSASPPPASSLLQFLSCRLCTLHSVLTELGAGTGRERKERRWGSRRFGRGDRRGESADCVGFPLVGGRCWEDEQGSMGTGQASRACGLCSHVGTHSRSARTGFDACCHPLEILSHFQTWPPSHVGGPVQGWKRYLGGVH